MAEAEIAGLNPQQQQALTLFQEVTAGARDASGCVQILRSCDWDAERALQLHWATAEDEPQASAASSASSGAGFAGLARPLLSGASPTAANEEGRPSSSSDAAAPQPGNSLLGCPTRTVRTVGSGLFGLLSGVIRAVLFGVGGQGMLGGGSSGAAFRRSLVDTYHLQRFPRFFEGTFREALQTARSELKLLVTFLHSEHARAAQGFCTQILGSEFIQSVLDENFVLWAGDVAWMETHQVAQMLHVRQYPHLCVLMPVMQGDEIRAIGALQGDVQVNEAVALFSSCLEEMDIHRSELVAQQAQHVEDRSLRAEQDNEYQEALALDRKREEERAAQAQALHEAEEQQRAARRQEEEEAAKIERQRKEQEERRRQQAATLALEGPDATSRISMRLPAGKSVQRKFLPSALLSEVYAWAECCAFLPEHAGKGLEVPSRFALKTSFPSRELTDMSASVEALQLAGAAILLTQIEDDTP